MGWMEVGAWDIERVWDTIDDQKYDQEPMKNSRYGLPVGYNIYIIIIHVG